MTFMKCWCHYTMHAPLEESTITHQHQMNMVFANCSKEDVIYPLTVKEIALAQERDLVLKKLIKMEKYSTHLVEDTEVLCKDGKMVIPKVLQRRAVSWHHHYLQYPGHTHLEETLHAASIEQVCKTPSDHMSKTVVHVKSTKDTSTSMENSLQSLSSQTFGRHYVKNLLGHTLSKAIIGQKMTLCFKLV